MKKLMAFLAVSLGMPLSYLVGGVLLGRGTLE